MYIATKCNYESCGTLSLSLSRGGGGGGESGGGKRVSAGRTRKEGKERGRESRKRAGRKEPPGKTWAQSWACACLLLLIMNYAI